MNNLIIPKYIVFYINLEVSCICLKSNESMLGAVVYMLLYHSVWFPALWQSLD